MEQALRACTLWLWLDQRFTGVFGHVDEVIALRERLNDGIAGQLRARRPLWQARQGRQGRPGGGGGGGGGGGSAGGQAGGPRGRRR